MIYIYFLPFCRLPFHYVDSLFYFAVFKFYVIPFFHFCLICNCQKIKDMKPMCIFYYSFFKEFFLVLYNLDSLLEHLWLCIFLPHISVSNPSPHTYVWLYLSVIEDLLKPYVMFALIITRRWKYTLEGRQKCNSTQLHVVALFFKWWDSFDQNWKD